jgi:hypothetical protein
MLNILESSGLNYQSIVGTKKLQTTAFPDDCKQDDIQNTLLLVTDTWQLEMLSLLIVVNCFQSSGNLPF